MHRSRVRSKASAAAPAASASEQLRASSAARARRAQPSPPLSSHFRRDTLSPLVGPAAADLMGSLPELDLGVALVNTVSRALPPEPAAAAAAASAGDGKRRTKTLGAAKRKRPAESEPTQALALQLATAAASSSVPPSSLGALSAPSPSAAANRKLTQSPRKSASRAAAPASASALVTSAMDIDDEAAAAPILGHKAKAKFQTKLFNLLGTMESQAAAGAAFDTPSAAAAAAASPASSSAAVATPAAKPGKGVPRAATAASAPKPVPTLAAAAAPASSRPTPVTQRQLKLSGNDAEHPIELDDAQPVPPVIPNTRKASAAAAANRGGPHSALINGSNHARGSSSSSFAAGSASAAGSSHSRSVTSGSASFHLVYPRSGLDQVVITDSDLALLTPHEFLNDSLIDFGLKHIYQQLDGAAAAAAAAAKVQQQMQQQQAGKKGKAKAGAASDALSASGVSKQDRFYFFNTFFYTRWLVAEGKRFDDMSSPFAAAMARSQSPFAGSGSSSSPAASAGSGSPGAAASASAGYVAVSKWTKKVDIFSRDFLVVPINESTHWSVAIICYPAKFFQPPSAAEGGKKTGRTSKTDGDMDLSSDPASATAALRSSASTRHARKSSSSAAAAASAASSPPRGVFQTIKDGLNDLGSGVGKFLSSALGGRRGAGHNSTPSPVPQDPFEEPEEEEQVPTEPVRKKARVGATAAAASSAAAAASTVSSPATPLSPVLSPALSPSSAPLAPDTDPTHVPAILYLDSLLPPPENLYEHLSRYLREEWAAKAAAGLGVPAQRPGWKWVQPPYIGGIAGSRKGKATAPALSPFAIGRIRGAVHYASDAPLYVMHVPEQQNGCDCGLYLLEYTRRFCDEGLRALDRFMQHYVQQQPGTKAAASSKSSSAGAGKIHTLASIAPSASGSGPKFEEIFFQQWNAQFPHQHMNSKRKQLRDVLMTLWRADMQAKD